MTTYVAFLRAINLGPTRKFPKADVVSATEAAGFADVATHLNTGNVRISTSMRSRARIEAALEKSYEADRGFAVPTIVVTTAELRDVAAAADEVAEGYTGVHYVSLLKDEPTTAAAAALTALSNDRERLVVRGRAVHLLLGENYHEAKLSNATVEKHLGVATNRNVTVVRTLIGKWC